MGWQGSLMPLFWILLLVYLTGFSIDRLRLVKVPSIIAYIVLGVLLGKEGFHLIPSQNAGWINGIGQFGLFYLMFLSGLEIDINILRINKAKPKEKHQFNALVASTLIFGCTLLLSFGLALLMYQADSRIKPWMMMLILSTTSLGIVLPVLKEQKLLHHVYGQLLLTIAFLADFIVMVIISVIGDLYTHGFSWNQLCIGLLLPLFYVSFRFITFLRHSPLGRKYFQSTSTLKMQAVLALLALYGIFSDLTGAEPMLGSFLAGILLSCFNLNEENQLRKQLEMIGYSLVIPIFFVMVGVHFPLQKLLSISGVFNWVLFLVVCAYAVKLLPMLWFGRAFGSQASIAGGFLLSSNLTLVIVATSIAVKYGILPSYINDAMLLVALITCIFSPILFSVLFGKSVST